MSRRLLILVLSVGPVLGVGTALGDPPNEDRPRGLVIVLGGVGGFDPLALSIQAALKQAGIQHDVYDYVWTHGVGQMFKDLQDAKHVQTKADELAERIRRFHELYPDRPLFLLAKSGGTGLALEAAELLAPGTLERIILLSAAVSADYDLRPALRATRGEIVSFHSKLDQFILNWGTRQFGTVDRVYGPSAGCRGFQMPKLLNAEDLVLYKRLVQVPWSPRMLLQGYAGNHTGTSGPGFLRVEVTPWLRY